MTLRPGTPWGEHGAEEPEREVRGSDAALAAAAVATPGARLRFRPDGSSDLARALGLTPGAPPTHTEVVVDRMRVSDAGEAVNAVVVGPAPDRVRWWSRAATTSVDVDGRRFFDGPATTVVVANGQYLRGLDVVPRGHPGDGRLEVQVYALARGERRAMRQRLPSGSHVPHPRIHQRAGRRIVVRRERPGRLEIDGRERGRAAEVVIEVVPGALRLSL